MKYIILSIALFIPYICNASTEDIFSVQNGEIVVKPNYIDSLFYSSDVSHEANDYSLYQEDSLIAGDYIYDIKVYTNTNDIADPGWFTDSIFSKIEIKCILPTRDEQRGQIIYDNDGNAIAGQCTEFSFIEDCAYTAFTQNGFNVTGRRYYEPASRNAYRKIPLSENGDIIALVFRGPQDGCSLRNLAIIVLYNGTATLVFNKEREITNMVNNGNTTTYIIQDNWWDEEDGKELVPNLHNMVFGNGTITID